MQIGGENGKAVKLSLQLDFFIRRAKTLTLH